VPKPTSVPRVMVRTSAIVVVIGTVLMTVVPPMTSVRTFVTVWVAASAVRVMVWTTSRVVGTTIVVTPDQLAMYTSRRGSQDLPIEPGRVEVTT